MIPVNQNVTFTMLVNKRSQDLAQKDLGLDLIGQNGIDVIDNPPTQTIISLYTALTGSLTVTPNSREMGQTYSSPVLNWSFNKAITSQSLNQSIGSLSSALRTYTHSTSGSSSITYILTASDGTTTITPQATINYYHRRFWGTTTNSSLTESEIESGTSELSNSRAKNITFDCTGGKRFWFAYPTYLGLSSVTVNGFPFTGWIGGTSPETISITNAYGYTENYYYYIINNIQNGSAIPVSFS